MGWFWENQAASPDSKSTPQKPAPTSEYTSTPQPPTSQPPPPQPEDEFAALWKELEAKTPSPQPNPPLLSSPNPTTTQHALPPPTSSTPTSTSPALSTPLPFSEAILPTTMSCRQTFDNAFYCQSFGGQFNSLYRYGEMRSCSALWGDFWFCMKTRTLSGEGKVNMIREYNKRKNEKYSKGPSSEDVWKSRDGFLEDGEAFAAEWDEVVSGETGEEWNERERKRREGRLGTLGS